MIRNLRKCTPAVGRYWLFLFGGILWSVVGIALSIMACNWLAAMDWPLNAFGVLAGFGSGVIIYRLGFSRVAGKNIDRIAKQPQKVCLFAFQAWRSYLLILFMMLLGYTLRHSHLPRIVISIIYAGIGSGLTFSSSLYYARFFGS